MLQLITDSPTPAGTLRQATDAMRGGCRWVQVRMKDADDATVALTVAKVCDAAREYDATVIVDDNVAVAASTPGCAGVHLGKNDMPPAEARKILGHNAIIGATVNSLDDIMSVDTEIVDYVGMGPYRFTSTKKNLSAILGCDGYSHILAEARKQGFALPVVAIGGITPDDVEALMQTGITGIAVSGAINHAANPVEATRLFIKAIQQNIKI